MMAVLYKPPTNVLVTSLIYDSPVSSSASSLKLVDGNPNALYKQITPRKKIDKFGIDQTNHTAYILSATVYPTGVKAPLLAEMQEMNPHKCGFDIVERPQPQVKSQHTSKATSIINAPPPTAEHSHRGSSLHSAVVANSEVSIGDAKPGSMAKAQNDGAKREKRYMSTFDVIKSAGLRSGEGEGDAEGGQQEQKDDVSAVPMMGDGGMDCPSEERIENVSLTRLKERLARERKKQSRRSRLTTAPSKPRVVSHTRFDDSRLIKYRWDSCYERTEEERKDGGDIRDPLYVNTYFPEERPVRYNKMSLPRIDSRGRARPWTVSESNISARAVVYSSVPDWVSGNVSKIKQAQWRRFNNAHTNVRSSFDGAHRRPVVPKETSRCDERRETESEDDPPLLEIRPFLTQGGVDDQREKLKGKDGCLHSRVKQCVRFVKYKEKLDRKEDDERPVKHEPGKYRPFSKTDVRNHRPCHQAPSPEAKLQRSVETYQKYVENVARETKRSSPKPFTFRGASRHNAATILSSANMDADSFVVQSVMDSNRPETSDMLFRDSTGCLKGATSAVISQDINGMSKALDIKRISPKQSTSRVVAGARGLNQREVAPQRRSSASTDEGVDMTEVAPTGPSAIVVPRAAKSECASEYSMSKDDNAEC